MSWVLFATFFPLLFLNIPISFVLILSTIAYILAMGGDVSWLLVPQRIIRGMDSFLMMCLPFFVLAGNLMNNGGITAKLIKLAQTFVGHIRGGLAMVDVIVCAFFGAVSGSAVAATSAVGSVMIPSLKKEGYPANFSAGLTAVASTMAPVIPPSLAFVIYGAVSKVPIGDLFVAGILPGILMAFALMSVVYVYAKRDDYPRLPRASWRERFIAVKESILCLLLPVFILGGIVSGAFTPTEASAMAALYAFILSMFIYKSITWKQLPKILIESAIDSGSVMLLVGTCYAFGWVLTNERVAFRLTEALLAMDVSYGMKLLLINLGLLIVGMFMDSAPAIMLVGPILAPALMRMGMNPVQAGIMVCLNLTIGLATPPVGVCLFSAVNLGKVSFEEVSKSALPFLGAVIVVLALITYVPWFSLVLLNIKNLFSM
ncbi:TRAP transporter large permease [Cloacibacillus evryensis]|uniref:TRAP transporter large permease n=1 Tax=Cloacibacillus evryensis TaxID=508460 RepID=A0AAW5K5L3_9BACT|nr:TRAP transporter large permease [Cloacibacillus evryensis]EHL69914.1 TRAP transporter, DctM subunit [Synergistes sp. 3_1_syn1]MCQ4813798.1 TRAP transporter large permease [Cloacibacillus evryensis]